MKPEDIPSPTPIPQAPDSERDLLGAIFWTKGKLIDDAIANGLTIDSFYELKYRQVYAVMLKLAQEGAKPDFAKMGWRMPDDTDLLDKLDGAVSTDVNFNWDLDALKKMEAARKVRLAAESFFKEISSNIAPKDVPALMSRLAKEMADGQAMIEGRRVMSLEKLFEAAGKWEPEATIPYFPKGTVGSFKIRHRRGEMHVISANTGAGKTALAAGAVRQQLEAGLVVAYFCFESDSVAIMRRIAAQFCGIPHYIMTNEFPDKGSLKRFIATLAELKEKYSKQIFIRGDETRISTPEAIRAELNQIVCKAGHVDVVVIDFLQIMQVPKFLATKSKMEQVNYCIEKLHGIFSEFRAAGIVLAQINRAGQQALGENERPGMEHIKDSSVIAQLAHTVSFLCRGKNNDEESTPAVFYSEKTRNQARFNLKLTWNGVGYESESESESESKGKRYSSDDIPPVESNGGGPEGGGDRGSAPDCI